MSLSKSVQAAIALAAPFAAAIAGLGPKPVAAEVPSEFFGTWSTSTRTCVDDPSLDVTVLTVDAAEVSWYEFTCSIIRSTPDQDGVSLAVDCAKGGSARGVGTINLSARRQGTLEAQFSAIGNISGPFTARFTQCRKPDRADTRPRDDGRSRWSHNGSTMYLVATGQGREIYYQRPRQGMADVGVTPDTLLFNGQVVDGRYVGTARIFRGECGQFTYRVSGPILDNGRRIVLRGDAPRIDKQCREAGTIEDTLEFVLIDD